MTDRKVELPSEKIERKAKEKQQLEEERELQESRLRGAIRRLADTDDGVIFLEWLSKECGWGDPFLAANMHTGQIDEKATVFQAFRVNLWFKIRKYLTFNQMKEVEHAEE